MCSNGNACVVQVFASGLYELKCSLQPPEVEMDLVTYPTKAALPQMARFLQNLQSACGITANILSQQSVPCGSKSFVLLLDEQRGHVYVSVPYQCLRFFALVVPFPQLWHVLVYFDFERES